VSSSGSSAYAGWSDSAPVSSNSGGAVSARKHGLPSYLLHKRGNDSNRLALESTCYNSLRSQLKDEKKHSYWRRSRRLLRYPRRKYQVPRIPFKSSSSPG